MSDPVEALTTLLGDHRAWLVDGPGVDCQCGYQAGHGIDWHQHLSRAVLDSGLVVPIDNHYASLGTLDRLLVAADAERARFKADRHAAEQALERVRELHIAYPTPDDPHVDQRCRGCVAGYDPATGELVHCAHPCPTIRALDGEATP